MDPSHARAVTGTAPGLGRAVVCDFALSCLAIRYLNGEVIRIDAATRLPDR